MALFASADDDKSLADATTFTKHTSGAELNVAIGLARLGLDIDYISQVGSDQFGDFLRSSAKVSNIGTDHFYNTPNYPTGVYFKERVSSGDPKVVYYRKGSATANFDINLLQNLDYTQYNFAHLTGIFPALSSNCRAVMSKLMQNLHKYNVKITFDPNLRPVLWESEAQMIENLNNYAKQSHIILPGIGEGKVLCGTTDPVQIADFYFAQSDITELVVVKLGEKGAYYAQRDYQSSGNAGYIEGFKVDTVVDTVGAGDGFSVGFLSGLMDGLDITECVKRACFVGARAVTVAGDSDGYPTRGELG